MAANPSLRFRFDGVEVREREFQLIKSGELLPVEPKAFRVLLFLLRNPHKLITKEELMNAVWGDIAVSENSLTRAIALLRRLLGDETHHPRFIETITTVGYRFICDVEAVSDGLERPGTAAEMAGSSGEVANAADVAGQIGAVTSQIQDQGKDKRRRRFRRLILLAVGVFAVVLGSASYIFWPQPTIRVRDYVQLTADGRQRSIGATDGTRLYLNRNRPQYLEQLSVYGGEPAQIPVDQTPLSVMGISPDGSTLLLRGYDYNPDGWPLWTLPVLGGVARRLGGGGYRGVAWSPDGNSMIYGTTGGDIFLAKSDGSEPRRVAAMASTSDWPKDISRPWRWTPWCFTWSPDSKRVRFKFLHTGWMSFWEMSPDGKYVQPIHTGWRDPGGDDCGNWTPDGKFFVFESGGQIAAFTEEHSLFRKPPVQPTQLTSGPIRWEGAVVSKDGKKIFSVGTKPRGELVRWNAQFRQPEPYLSGISGEQLDFSPDGKEVAYISFPEGDLWCQKLDGSGRVQLTKPPIRPILPSWSPDGARIVFSDTWLGGVYVASRQGGVRTLVPGKEQSEAGDPTWSPDGRRIVFATKGDDPRSELRILDVDSNRVTKIPGSDRLWSPRWSPDGTFILARTLRSAEQPGLKMFFLRTQRWSDLARVNAEWPVISHDSRYIYFFYGLEDKEIGVYRVSVGTGKIEEVIGLKDMETVGWAAGTWIGLDPADSLLFLRDRSTHDVYALTLEEK